MIRWNAKAHIHYTFKKKIRSFAIGVEIKAMKEERKR